MVDREGIAGAVIAFAATVQAPPIANYGLSLILQGRLARDGLTTKIYPSSFGQSLSIAVRSAEGARFFVEHFQRALSREISLVELDTVFLDRVADQFGAGRDDSPGEITLARCSGELYRDARQAAALADGTTLMRWLEEARKQAFSRERSRFAVVGTAQVAGAIRTALSSITPWPKGERVDAETTSSLAPRALTITVSPSQDRTLSIAWTTGSLSAAISAWRALREPDSPLVSQLAAMDVDWRVETISAVARPVGACMRVDLSQRSPTAAQAAMDWGRVARLAMQESRFALAAGPGSYSLRLSGLFGSEPSLVARQAAWQSLSVDQKESAPTLQVHMQAPKEEAAELQSGFAGSLEQVAPSTIEYRFASAKGETQYWMLLGSRCAASAEFAQNSGATATWLRAVARKFSGIHGVTLEPWVSDEGIGLLAHGSELAATETHESVAQRIASALGRAVVTDRIDGSALAFAREESIVHVGAEPRRAWNLLLEGLSSRRPSCFEPEGNVNSLRYLNLADLVTSRRRWLAEPLRVAAISGENGLKPSTMSAPIARWLEPHRVTKGVCESVKEDESPEQGTQLVTYSPDDVDANAYLVFRLNEAEQVGQQYDEVLAWSLNRKGGWLDRLLVEPGSARAARAHIRGPSGRRVLILELYAADESATKVAVDRARSVLADLANAGVPATELTLTLRWAEQHFLESAMDPRARLVRLWLGSSDTPPTKAGFTKYLTRALGLAPATVMTVRK
jgi:hypothetical protein